MVSKAPLLLGPFLVEMVKTAPQAIDMTGLRQRDAVYCSVGLCASDLRNVFDFETWLLTRLVAEYQLSTSDLVILKRRILWLVEKWLPVKLSPQNRGSIYQLVLLGLDNEEDLVVRLTAVDTLQTALDDFDFGVETFRSYLPSILEKFMDLLGVTDEFDSKMKILECIIAATELMAGDIVPHISPIMNLLPGLWARSEGQNLFRSAVVTIVAKLVASLRGESHLLSSITAPILSQSLDTSNPCHIHLFDAGLDLWLAVLQNSAECSDALHSLFPKLFLFLEDETENMKRVIRVVEGYILLSPVLILGNYAQPLCDRISQMLQNLTPAASNVLLRCLDVTIQSAAHANCWPSLSALIYNGPLIDTLIQVVLHQNEMNQVVVGYLMILCRILLYDPELFIRSLTGKGADVLSIFVDVFLDKVHAYNLG